MFTTFIAVALATSSPQMSVPNTASPQGALDQFTSSYRFARCGQMHFDRTKDENFNVEIASTGSISAIKSLSGSSWGKCISQEIARLKFNAQHKSISLVWVAADRAAKYQPGAIEGVASPYFLYWDIPRT